MLEVKLSEDQVALLARGFMYLDKSSLPSSLVKEFYFYNNVNLKKLKPFLIKDGVFNSRKAAKRILNLSDIIHSHHSYYRGERGWSSSRRSSRGHRRVEIFDSTFDIALEEGKVAEVIEQIIDCENTDGSLNSNCRAGVIGWLIKNKCHHDPKVAKLFLKGYFKTDEKVQIMDALISDKKLAELEVFWKSRAFKVKSKMIEIAPVAELPFLLSTKDKRLLSLIEKKMSSIK